MFSDNSAERPLDRVKRQFQASRPNQLCVVDFTYGATCSGFVYVAFVIDVIARRIVGWRAARSMHTELVLDALAETIIGRYKTEVIHRRGPWRHFDAVEYATLEWVDWLNHRRLLEPIGDVPPAELEMAYHRQQNELPLLSQPDSTSTVSEKSWAVQPPASAIRSWTPLLLPAPTCQSGVASQPPMRIDRE